jgi:hypothetical protein
MRKRFNIFKNALTAVPKKGGDEDLLDPKPVNEETETEQAPYFNKEHLKIAFAILIVMVIIYILYKKLAGFDGNKITKGLRSDSQSSSWDLKERIDKLMDKQNKYFNI